MDTVLNGMWVEIRRKTFRGPGEPNSVDVFIGGASTLAKALGFTKGKIILQRESATVIYMASGMKVNLN